MKRRLPFLISAFLLCVSLGVLFRIPPSHRKTLAEAFTSEVAALLPTPSAPAKPAVDAQDLPETGGAVVTIPPEAARMQELRIAAIRNGVHYGWIQLPRGTPVELLRRDGDWMLVRYDEVQLKIHRAVADAGLIVPRTRHGARLAGV